jgi:hypothetical protein
LELAFQLPLAERRQGNAEKADAFGDREQWLEQRVAKLLEFGSRRKERLTGPASRDLLEIGKFHFQCHRAPANLCSLASARDLFDDRLERLASFLQELIGTSETARRSTDLFAAGIRVEEPSAECGGTLLPFAMPRT